MQEGHHILDVGCGTGDDVLALARIVGETGRVVGIDNSETMIAEARQRAEGLDLVTSDYNHGPFAGPGGLSTVNSASSRSLNHESLDLTYSKGALLRLVVENTPAGLVGRMSLPGGQRHFRDSPFYDNLLEPYLRNEPFVVPFTPEEVEAAAVETIVVRPAAE